MGINKVGSIEAALGAMSASDSDTLGDQAKRHQTAREQDLKNTALSRFANETGTTVEELKKQGEIHKKMGFSATLLEQIEETKK